MAIKVMTHISMTRAKYCPNKNPAYMPYTYMPNNEYNICYEAINNEIKTMSEVNENKGNFFSNLYYLDI